MSDATSEQQMQVVFEVVKSIRKFRSENQFSKKVRLVVCGLGALSRDQRCYIAQLGNCEVLP